MSKINLKRLSDLELSVPAIEVLEKINRNGHPVLCSLNPKLSVWGIDSNLHELTEEIAYEVDAFARYDFRNKHKKTREQFFSSRHIENVKYVRLHQQDIKQITSANSSVEVNDVPSVFTMNDNGDLEEMNWFNTTQYLPHDAEEMLHLSRHNLLSTQKFVRKLCDDEFQFVFTPNTTRTVTYFNSPMEDTTSLDVKLKNLYVFHNDIKDYLVNHIDEIKSDSDYYVPEKYRGISLLDDLAVFADKWYRQHGNTGNKGLKVDLQRKLIEGSKKAAAAAFFLSQEPKGNRGKDLSISDGCQFPFLVKALEQHLETRSTPDHQNQKVFNYLFDQGFAEDNAKYGELLSRPTKKV